MLSAPPAVTAEVAEDTLPAPPVALNTAEQLGKRLRLVNVTPGSRLYELLDLTGLISAFELA